jgi:3-hydroxyacyl-[acyl-carrier-protein] dehydratase
VTKSTDSTNPVEILEGTFYFDPEDAMYRDHFPGNPVVPGSLIVDAFLQTAMRRGWIKKGCEIQGFRFSRFVPPGTAHFRMEPCEGGKILECKLHSHGHLSVTGRLCP